MNGREVVKSKSPKLVSFRVPLTTLLYLSPYSPDFNPIELLFSKLKALVRGAAPRTISDVISSIGRALQEIQSMEIRAWFKHAHPKFLLWQML